MNKVYGYLELNGNIFKITSIDELKEFVVRVGSEFKELSENEFKQLCKNEGSMKDDVYDDCGVSYSADGKKLKLASKNSLCYKVKDNTVIIGEKALKWFEQRDYNYKLTMTHHPEFAKFCMSDSVIGIGSEAFAYNLSLQNFIVSSCLQFIGEGAFCKCHNLNEFEIPKTLKYIGANAFEGCGRFIKVIFGNAIKKIGSHAFKDCKNLEVVSIPSSLEIIGSGIFEGCDKLREIRIPKGTKERFSKEFPFCKDKLIECDNDIH